MGIVCRAAHIRWCLVVAIASLAMPAAVAQDARPNIIHIFADDLGWGSVGFNNPATFIQTPTLDNLATGGMVLNRSYASTVCSPSRAMLYTGFHNGHALNDRNGNIGAGLAAVDVTIAEVMSAAGYGTATFGKWGWGASGDRNIGTTADPLPTLGSDVAGDTPSFQGFDRFYGYLNHSAAHDQNYSWAWQSSAQNVAPTTSSNAAGNYMPDLYTREAEAYIRDNTDGPFYMQLNYTNPHFDIDAMASAGTYVDLYGNQVGPENLGDYASDGSLTDIQRKYAAAITRMDAHISSVVARLEDPNGDGNTADSILDNTLIIFSSDNGATPEDGFGAANVASQAISGGLRGGKRDLYEGGIRAPGLAYWRGTIAAGTSTDLLNDLADVQATAAELAGVLPQVGIDGVSILPTLTGQGIQRERPWLLFENFEGSQTGQTNTDWTIIRGNDKLIKFRTGAFGLYNVATDINEANPLDLNVPANAALKAELEAIALAEGAGRADSYAAQYASFSGADGSAINSGANWNLATAPADTWVATVDNTSLTARRNVASSNVTVLGLEVAGSGNAQTLDIAQDVTVHGRNEVRINAGGHITLANATLSSVRWVDVLAGGKLSGQGTVQGQIYNQGTIAPGREASLPPVGSGGGGGGTPAPLAPRTLDTGVQSPLIQFDFAGTQDQSPLINLTSGTQANAQYLDIAGFAFGPATSPRNASNAGSEFNVQGWSIGSSLQSAIDGGNYLTFTVDPDLGAGIELQDLTVGFWRNGLNTANDFAILSSVGGFNTGAILAQGSYADGNISQQFLTAPFDSSVLHTGPVEFRIYGWNANQSAGNTHFNYVALDGRVRSAPTFAFNFAGVQDNGPLTAVSVNDANLVVTQGFNFGPGTQARTLANAGNEFNVSSWTVGGNLQGAITADDYVSFAVAPAAGFTMVLDSVSFDLWRNGANSPAEYAILTSIDGFTAADALATTNITTTGSVNEQTFTATFAADTESTGPVEFRLYGWNAGNTDGHTHITGASLRATYYTSPSAPVAVDETGILNLVGKLHHLAGSTLEMEIGGSDNADPDAAQFDQILVDGDVALAGDLSLTLVDDFVPVLGTAFDLIVADTVTGTFANVDQLPFSGALGLQLLYESDRVQAIVAPFLTGDFNVDGVVDAADYTVWRDLQGASTTAFGTGDANGDTLIDAADLALWRANFGATLPPGDLGAGAVPEPSTWALAALGAGLLLLSRRR